MTFSDEQAKSEMERAVVLVETSIRGLGVDPDAGRVEREGHVAFALRRGSARILAAIHASTPELPGGRLRVVAPVVHLPAPEHEALLYRRLLEANATELVNAAFAISGREVVIVSERSLRDLDGSEVDSMIRVVGRLADRYDDELAAAYGVRRSSDG